MPFDNANYQPDDDVLRCLSEGRALIANGWEPYAFSRDAGGVKNYGLDTADLAKGVTFCSCGAVFRASSNSDVRQAAHSLLDIAARVEGYRNHIDANTRSSQKVVLEVWDRAIAARSAELVVA